MKKSLILLFMLITAGTTAQEIKEGTNTRKGEISFGVRSSGSIFSASGNYFGAGAGWQVRYRISDRFSTEWFADWVTTDIGGLGQRYDAHIGESTMLYPFRNPGEKNRFAPYILGGFCGDYTKVRSNIAFDDAENTYARRSKDRWSFATQLGLGTSYNITERFDISFSTQYILHFGADIGSTVGMNSLGQNYLMISNDTGGGIEGHLLFSLSANFVVMDILTKQ